MGKKILLIVLLVLFHGVTSHTEVIPVANRVMQEFEQKRSDLYRVFTRQSKFLKGSIYPIRLVIFQAGSQEQSKLGEFLNIHPLILEQQLQRTNGVGSIPKRVSNSDDMIKHVTTYVGSLGYIPEQDVLIFNRGGSVIKIKIKEGE